MSLIETICCMKKAWAHLNVQRPPRMSVAAWFPYHFVQPELEADSKFKTQLPREGFGIDSLGMFYIGHGNSKPAQAAWVSPIIDYSWVEALQNDEGDGTWDLTYTKEGNDQKRYFLKFSPKTGYPGQHSMMYMRMPGKQKTSLKDQVKRFLEPHTDSDMLKTLDEQRLNAYRFEHTQYMQYRTSGSGDNFSLHNCSFPLLYHDYIRVRELRMDMREWTQNNRCIQLGTHFPLCIKLGGICRRSRRGQLGRNRGTKEFREKREKKESAGVSPDNTKTAGSAKGGKKFFGIGPKERLAPTAQAVPHALRICSLCGGRKHTENSCPVAWMDQVRPQAKPRRRHSDATLPPPEHQSPQPAETLLNL